MCVIIVAFMIIQMTIKPWRGVERSEQTFSVDPNVVDGTISGVLLLFLVCGAVSTDYTAKEGAGNMITPNPDYKYLVFRHEF